ncbi:MAG: hypothetical protein JSV26_03035 [bacterium]|nr:MAG: hypothetical protein JSV26_03035 [bacterium]
MHGITALVSVYPLRQDDLSPSISAVLDVFDGHDVQNLPGAMGTIVWGDDERIFHALLDGFRRAADRGDAVMVITVSNACPRPGEQE